MESFSLSCRIALLIFKASVFRATVFRATVFRATVFRATVFRATVFHVSENTFVSVCSEIPDYTVTDYVIPLLYSHVTS